MWRGLVREEKRPGLTVGVLAVSAALAAPAGPVRAQEAEDAPRLEGLKRLDLPREVARSVDVRWIDDGEVVLGVIGSGINVWRLDESGAELQATLEEPAPRVFNVGGREIVSASRRERDYGRLAVSSRGVAFADDFTGLHLANEDGIGGPTTVEFLGDLDRRGSLTAAVGLILTDDDGWAPYAAWLIEDGGGSPRGLLPTRDGGRGLEACSVAELSVVRFVSDDRMLVIPGAEAGVFVYDRDGALRDSLDAATFFAESGCDNELDEFGSSPLHDAYRRADWLGPRRIVDEVVADGAGNVYFFVRYGAASRRTAELDAAPGPRPALDAAGNGRPELRGAPGRRAITTGIAATLRNTDPACTVPLCYEPASPGRAAAGGVHRWRPVASVSLRGSGWRFRHHVALRSGVEAEGLVGQRPGVQASRRQPRMRVSQPSRQNVNRVRAGSVADRVVASVPPPRGRVCWDLVHAHVDDLRTVSRQQCAVESEFADTRLRADLRGDRAVILLRGGALRGGDARAAEAFEARLLPPTGAEG